MNSKLPLHFHAYGKLLLTGEYVVLDGARALAVPTRLGQTLTIAAGDKKGCVWTSKDENKTIWFEAHFESNEGNMYCSEEQLPIAQRLFAILKSAQQLNPTFLPFEDAIHVETTLEFARDWGLGTSSTLLYNIAQWAQVDPVVLLQRSFGGSGYDVAVAKEKHAIVYNLNNEKPEVSRTTLPWNFKQRLFFVHLNNKQDSKKGIALYREVRKETTIPIQEISDLTYQISTCTEFDECTRLFEQHEAIISQLLRIPTVKSKLFSDYSGFVKSLGAWGGDFVLVGGDEKDQDYFRKKGFQTIVPFSEMISDKSLV